MSVFTLRRGGVPSYGPPLLDNFADNEWSTIIWACQTGNVPEEWTVGSQKTMPINGTDYPIDIIGKNHDTYADGSGTAPLTFQMHDLYGTKYKINSSVTNATGWWNCDMRNTHLPAIISLMPSEVQAGIREVNKLTSAGNKSSTINTTADKLFLLSEVEVLGTSRYSMAGEGARYEYYTAGNSVIKTLNGSATTLWLRSPYKTDAYSFCIINGSGTIGSVASSYAWGVAFAFCF